MDSYSNITFNPAKVKAVKQLEALKSAHKREQLVKLVQSTLFFVCLLACLWFGLLLF